MRSMGIAMGVLALLITMPACGEDDPPTTTTGQRYHAGASFGDLLTYTLDPSALTYSFSFVDSQFGLAGQQGAGTLQLEADGSFTPSSAPGARVFVLPNGMVFGAATVDFGGQPRLMLFGGAPIQPGAYNPAEVAGTYNTIEYSCDKGVDAACGEGAYFTSPGTLKVNVDGTFVACAGGNVDDTAANPCIAETPGTWTDQGDGLVAVDAGGMRIGTATMVAAATGGRTIIMDLRETAATTPGLMVGVRKIDVAGEDLSGTYRYTGDDGNHGEVTVDSAANTYSGTSVEPGAGNQTYTGTLTRNVPWEGWLQATDSGGTPTQVLILPGDGVFFNTSFTSNDWIDLGGKL